MSDTLQEITADWYQMCTTRSFQYPVGSIEQIFWWSLRFLFDQKPSFDDWIEYFSWKLKQQACWKHHTNHLAEDMCSKCDTCWELCDHA